MKRLETLFCVSIMFLPLGGCLPPAGQPEPGQPNGSKRVDRYSVQAMTAALVEIEKEFGTEKHANLLARYEREYRADPKHPFKRFLWAFSLTDRNEAWGELTKITKLNDKFYWAFLAMGIILDGWKVDDQAEMSFKKALELGPKIAIGHGRAGKMYLRLGRFEDAIRQLQTAMELDPKVAIYQVDLARAKKRSGKREEAKALYEKVIQLAPGHFPAHRELGFLLEELGEKEKAIGVLRKAAELDPKAVDVRLELAKLLEESGDLDSSLSFLTQACELQTGEIACWQSRAELTGKMKNIQEQVVSFERIVKVEPDNVGANKFLAPIYLERGEIERALPAYQVVLKKEPENIEVMAGLATIYDRGGEYSKAIELVEMIHKKNPEHQSATEIRTRLFKRFHILEEKITGKSPDEVFSRNRRQIANVYKARLEKKPGMHGDMLVKVTVADDGKVTDVSMTKNTLGDQVIDICTVWNLRLSAFPAGFGATYDFELTLKPGE